MRLPDRQHRQDMIRSATPAGEPRFLSDIGHDIVGRGECAWLDTQDQYVTP